MRIFGSRRTQAAVIAVAAGSLALTACGGGSGNSSKGQPKTKTQQDAKKMSEPVKFGDAAASTGPAPAVPGAHSGGTMQVYQKSDFSHLDPGQTYVSDGKVLDDLLQRGLTQYAQDANGNLTVVGDLATDSGKESDGGKTWTYTLKDGIKDQNGNAITSAVIRHSIERLYASFETDGPTYVQQWLSGAGSSYRKALPKGGYDGKHLPDSVLATPDAKTVVFHFKTPEPDLPQALTMPGYSAVPIKGDTKQKYDQMPLSTGPYKIADFKPGKSMTLVKNPQWDPKTDSVRHQYVDGFDINLNVQNEDQTKAILADRGNDKNAMMWTGAVATTEVPTVTANKAAMKRTIQGYQPYVWQMNFNMNRIKDKRIRDAIAYAMPSAQMYKLDGGAFGGEVATGLLAPTLPGFDPNFDPFGKKKMPNGNIPKAKKLIKEAGAEGKKVVYAYANTQIRQQQSVVITNMLKKIGLDPVTKEVDNATWYEQMGKIKNGMDLYMTGWGQDWPSASTVIPPSYDGTNLQDGSSDYSHINDPKVNADIAKAEKITDPAKAKAAWTAIHEDIVKRINPAAPVYFTKTFQIFGSNVGGLRYSNDLNEVDVKQVFLKK
ncbi:ABC transporter substrate-binding protein [Streptomyces montanisoli]|uniref:ABC transporter substrate-binding protein n=1 Tax=Streptomyces montanisoli TaxID=2798581 RepID=A0A940MCI9_9ACTN|nr:ABC transporter substrate-binding protein [Streptomyces montanisoli]MBP0458398.1 ABC transporter substrate-binding protein [Streptomyces montanisoli]